MRIIIIANGHFDHFKNDRAVMLLGDILIAADGGVRHLQKLGLTPNVLIGDLDSLSPAEEANLENAGTEIIRHPTDKDETDLELALLHALKLGADEILLFAALGERWDMTFANILLLADPRFARVNVRVFSEKEEMFVIHSGETRTLQGQSGDTVSLLPLGGNAMGVTLQGLAYSVDDATLKFGSPRGVSNVMERQEAVISLREGVLLCVHGTQVHTYTGTQSKQVNTSLSACLPVNPVYLYTNLGDIP